MRGNSLEVNKLSQKGTFNLLNIPYHEMKNNLSAVCELNKGNLASTIYELRFAFLLSK